MGESTIVVVVFPVGTHVILLIGSTGFSHITIESPEQISGGEGAEYIARSWNETVKHAESIHPVESVATTQYVPGVLTVTI